MTTAQPDFKLAYELKGEFQPHKIQIVEDIVKKLQKHDFELYPKIGIFFCGQTKNAIGCQIGYKDKKQVILVDKSLLNDEFQSVFLHEVGHYLFNDTIPQDKNWSEKVEDRAWQFVADFQNTNKDLVIDLKTQDYKVKPILKKIQDNYILNKQKTVNPVKQQSLQNKTMSKYYYEKNGYYYEVTDFEKGINSPSVGKSMPSGGVKINPPPTAAERNANPALLTQWQTQFKTAVSSQTATQQQQQQQTTALPPQLNFAAGEPFKFENDPTMYIFYNSKPYRFADETAYQAYFGDKNWSRVQTISSQYQKPSSPITITASNLSSLGIKSTQSNIQELYQDPSTQADLKSKGLSYLPELFASQPQLTETDKQAITKLAQEQYGGKTTEQPKATITSKYVKLPTSSTVYKVDGSTLIPLIGAWSATEWQQYSGQPNWGGIDTVQNLSGYTILPSSQGIKPPSESKAEQYNKTTSLQEGQVYKTADNPTVYLYKGGSLYSFTDEAAYQAFFGDKDWSRVQTIGANQLKSVSGTKITAQNAAQYGGKTIEPLAPSPTPDAMAEYKEWQENQPKETTYPIFSSGATHVLVRFKEDPTPYDGYDDTTTVWRFDVKNKTYTPFSSIAALENAYGAFWSEIQSKYLNTLSVNDLNTPEWGGNGAFKFLTRDQGYQEDGRLPGGEGIEAAFDAKYGQTENPDVQKDALFGVDGMLKFFRDNSGGQVSAATIDEVLKDNSILSLYTNAIAYGGYTFIDMARDLKRRELIKQGRTELKNTVIISPTMTRDQYYSTPEGQAVLGNSALAIPPQIGGIDMSLFDFSIFKIPQEAFEILVPPLPLPTTPEFRALMDEIKSAYHDVAIKQLEANTDTQKAVAEYDWNRFKEEMAKKFHIELSNDAGEAWSQIESIGQTMTGRGLTDSGLQQEIVDKMLQERRKIDERMREEQVTEKELKDREYYVNYASPEEINNFIASNRNLADKWGLIPSAETKQWFTKENLKTLYPDLQDWEIERYIDAILDKSGNYRSQLYQNLMSNKLNLLAGKETLQAGKLEEKKSQEEEKAYEEYTKGEDFIQKQKQEEINAQNAKILEQRRAAQAEALKTIGITKYGTRPETPASATPPVSTVPPFGGSTIGTQQQPAGTISDAIKAAAGISPATTGTKKYYYQDTSGNYYETMRNSSDPMMNYYLGKTPDVIKDMVKVNKPPTAAEKKANPSLWTNYLTQFK